MRVETKDGRHGVEVVEDDGYFRAVVVAADERGRFRFLFPVGYYKSEKGAIKAAARKLSAHGIEL